MTTLASNSAAAPPHAGTTSRPRRRLGWVITALIAAFLAFDVVIHLLNLEVAREGSVRLGYDPSLTVLFGVLELIGLVLYLYRRTSVLGAVYLTAYLGGAFASQLRVDAPLFSTLLFPVYTGLLLWLGLWLRDADLRVLTPVRRAG